MLEKLGICLEGNEPYFLAYLRRQLAQWPNGTYLEVGAASGQTFAPVVKEIRESVNRDNWAALAIDVPAGWSFNKGMIEAAVPGLLVRVHGEDLEADGESFRGDHLVVHPAGVRAVDLAHWPAIRFAFIDGCHGAPCVKADFEYVEKFCVPGSIVAFHDVNKECQGIHIQPHCKTGIAVRQGLAELRLLNPYGQGQTRPGWRLLHEVTGVPHACAFFEMV